MKILKKILKFLGLFLLVVIVIVFLFLGYINLPVNEEREDVKLGVTFSNRYAQDIGLDWHEAFFAMLDDLKIKKIRIPVYWDQVESQEGKFDFSQVDWQLKEAEKRNAEIVLVIGQKVPRWPECFIPSWANVSDQKRKESLINFVGTVAEKYKNEKVIKYWQIENEPFLNFGICPASDANLLDREISQVRSKDTSRKIIITDSGELSLWVKAAKRADIFGTTMYRTIWSKKVGYYKYPIGPKFFQFKNMLNKIFAKQNNAIVIELQAEPWINGWTVARPLEEQFSSMNPNILADNVSFAKKVGFPEVYLWGVEWWYWLKKTQNHPELWNEAKLIFSQN